MASSRSRCLAPAIAEQRLSADGLVVYELKRAFSDGTMHVLFEPHDFIARITALVLRPRGHLVRMKDTYAFDPTQGQPAHRAL